MRLIISRSQQAVTGMMGGHKGMSFTLRYQMELTAEEQDLVERYKLEEYPVTFHDDGRPFDTIRTLLQGRRRTVDDVATLLLREETVKVGCDSLPILFEVVRTFGGDEIVDYPR